MEVQLSIPKQEFLDQILNTIQSSGFEEVDLRYEKTTIHRQHGQTIIINGQQMEQPGKPVQIKHVIYFNGDGWVANEDESDKREFTQIKFVVEQDDQTMMEYEDCFYWDDVTYFINIFNQFNR